MTSETETDHPIISDRICSLFIQAFMSRRITTRLFAKSIYDDLRGDNPDDFQAFLREINQKLSRYDFELKQIRDKKGVSNLCLVNMNSDEIAKIGTTHSPAEIQYFKLLIDELFLNNYRINSIKAINLSSKIKPAISKQHAQDCLDEFVMEKWLIEDQGNYELSPRSAAELEHYLRENFEDFQDCAICKDPIYNRACNCFDINCRAKIHLYCADKLQNTKNFKCPQCGNSWENVETQDSQPQSLETIESSQPQISESSSSQTFSQITQKTRKRSRSSRLGVSSSSE